MPTRHADAEWNGSLKEGSGTVKVESGLFDGPYNYVSRFESGTMTNPEELLGAAHAGCYSMFLSALLSKDNHTVNSIKTGADVTVTPGEGGPTITSIILTVEADVSEIDEATFLTYAARAKEGCPVSKALASVPEITLNASLVTG